MGPQVNKLSGGEMILKSLKNCGKAVKVPSQDKEGPGGSLVGVLNNGSKKGITASPGRGVIGGPLPKVNIIYDEGI